MLGGFRRGEAKEGIHGREREQKRERVWIKRHDRPCETDFIDEPNENGLSQRSDVKMETCRNVRLILSGRLAVPASLSLLLLKPAFEARVLPRSAVFLSGAKAGLYPL